MAFFITGTDTEIGKTFVSRLLADSFSTFTSVTYMKPVQTGCIRTDSGDLSAPDFDFVMQGKASMIAGYEDHVPYRYEPACSPHLAAKLSGDFIKMEYLHDRFEYIANRETHVTLVEGAGGLYVPLNDHDFMIDLIYQLKLPTILVTSSRLGTLNQTLLSIRTLQNARIPLAGVIFNNYPEAKEAYIYRDNLAMIREYSRPVPFLEVHYGDVPNATVREFCNRIGQI